MELKHLEAFIAVLEHGSISAAARSLGKGQSQISQWLSDLETDVNMKLFHRTGNRSEPTEEAYEILPYIRKLLTAKDELAEVADNISSASKRHISVAIDEWIPAIAVHDPITQFLVGHSEITTEIKALPRCDVVKAVQEGMFDIGLVSEIEDHHPSLSYQRIGFFEDIYVAGSRLIENMGNRVTVEQLSRQRELVWSTSDTSINQEPIIISNSQPLSPNFLQTSDFTLLKSLLIENIGYALLPRQLIQQELNNGELSEINVEFEQVPLQRRVELIWRSGRDACPTVSAFLSNIQNHHGYG